MSPLTPFLWLLALLPLFVIAYFNSQKTNLKYLFFFVILFLADYFLSDLSHHLDIDLSSFGLRFNWIGKFLSLLLSLIVIYFLSKSDKEAVGFTTKTHRPTLKFGVLIFLGFLIFDIIFKLIIFPKGGSFDLETFAFQATMPGLTEELTFRGLYLWLLSKAFVSKWKWKGVDFGWGFIIVTILFGVCHGLIIDNDMNIHYDMIAIIYITIVSGLSLGLLRKFSGNLIYPIVGHNLVNVANAVIRIL